MSRLQQTIMAGISAVSILAASSTALADTTHMIKPGDTLWGLSREYHTTVSYLKELNGLYSDVIFMGRSIKLPDNGDRTSSSTLAFASTKAVTHIIKPGDTLWQLAFDHNTSVQALKTLNHLHSDVISIGQQLLIPAQSAGVSLNENGSQNKRTAVTVPAISNETYLNTGTSDKMTELSLYTVKLGDTLSQIAQSYDISISTLKDVNNLHNDSLEAGQKLEIVNSDLADVPPSLVPIYQAAGQKYGIPWTVLAAIHKIETHYCKRGNIVSSAGAEGPMQFLPTTFAEYGVTAPERIGPPDIWNVDDAIYTAANYLAQNGYATSPEQAIYAYNHSNEYVKTVMTYSEV